MMDKQAWNGFLALMVIVLSCMYAWAVLAR